MAATIKLMRTKRDEGGRGHAPGIYRPLYLKEICTFGAAAATNFWQTASIAPSSNQLVAAMVAPCAAIRPRIVVEFGVGTGAVTRALLAALPADALVIGFEINERLARYVCQQISDRRLVMIQDSAEKLPSVLGRLRLPHIDAVVSSLGLTGMKPVVRRRILQSMVAAVRPGGVFTQYQYIHSRFGYLQLSRLRFHRFDEGDFLREFFTEVDQRWVGWNLPPALVFTCRK